MRAGALLVLHLHPSDGVLVAAARKALDDPSDWVRLTAAGLLAVRKIDAGEKILVAGLEHEQREVRFWCIFALHALAKPGFAKVLRLRVAAEDDAWLQSVLGQAIYSLWGKP